MKTLMIEASEDSPFVLMDYKEGKVVIKGRSFMEDPQPFQEAIIDWFRTYVSFSQKPFVVEIEMEYLSSSSHHMLMFIIAELNKYFIFGQKITITWSFLPEDEYMKEVIEEFQDIFEVPIKEFVLA